MDRQALAQLHGAEFEEVDGTENRENPNRRTAEGLPPEEVPRILQTRQAPAPAHANIVLFRAAGTTATARAHR